MPRLQFSVIDDDVSPPWASIRIDFEIRSARGTQWQVRDEPHAQRDAQSHRELHQHRGIDRAGHTRGSGFGYARPDNRANQRSPDRRSELPEQRQHPNRSTELAVWHGVLVADHQRRRRESHPNTYHRERRENPELRRARWYVQHHRQSGQEGNTTGACRESVTTRSTEYLAGPYRADRRDDNAWRE